MQPKDAQHPSAIPKNSASVMTAVMEALNLICWNVAGASWWIDTSRVKMVGDMDYWLRVPAPAIISQEHTRSTGERIIGQLRVLRYGQSVCLAGIKLTPQQPRERIYVETIHSDTGGHWKVLWTDCNQHLTLHSNSRGQTYHLVKKVPVQLGPDIYMNGWVSGRMCNMSDKTSVTSRTLTYNWCFMIPLPIDCLSYVTVLLSPPQIIQTTLCVRTTPPTHVHDSTNEGSTQFDNDHTMCSGGNITRVNQTTFISRQIQTAYNNLGSNGNISTGPVKPFNLTKSSCLAAVLPLFDPETRLTMLMQEVHPFQFASNHHSSDHRSRSVEQLFTAHSCSSYTSIQAARSESPAADQPNCYTYIRTKEGLPAYTNGASISPKKSSTDDTYLSFVKSTYYQADRSINTFPSIEPRPHNIFRNSSQSLEHLKNESWRLPSNPLVSKTYMLKQLEVISSPESIPPPWMTKLRNTRTFWRQSSERSWSTIGTPDSGPHPDDEILPAHAEEHLSLGVDHQIDSEQSLSSECMQLGQQATHSRSVSSEHVSQPRRISLLIEILSELNVLAEQVLTHYSEDVFDDSESSNLFDYPLVSDRCKQILSKLSVLCEDGEEEELPDSDLHTTETRLCSSRVPVVPKSESALSAICYPLPLHSRIASSTRLLVCYFEILSELADLQAEQRKFQIERHRQWSDVIDLAAALLRLFNTPPRLEQARDLQAEHDSCNTGLQVLFCLRDLIRMAPGVLDRRSTVFGTPTQSIAEAKRIMDMCITQIETAIEEHLEWLKRLVEQESLMEQKRLTSRTIWNDGRSYLDQVEWFKKDVIQKLSTVSEALKEFDTGLMEAPTEGDHVLLDFTRRSSCLETHLMRIIPTEFSSRTMWAKMVSECTLELPYLERYLHEPWLPVQKWKRVTSKDQLVQNLSDWHIAEVESWKETTEFLKAQFATLLPLADWLRLNEPRNPDACRDPKVEALTNRMLEAWTQALDRATQLEFFQQLVKLPNGLGVLIQQLCALEHQLRAEDTLHNSSAMELTIQQLQYQFCIEGASLSALFKRFNQVPSGSNPGSTWLGLWIDRVREAYESVVHLWELRVRQRRQHALVQSFEAWILCAEKCLDEMAQRSELHTPKELLAKSNTSVSLIWSLICEAQVLHEVAWHVQQYNLDSENTRMTLMTEKMNTCLRKLNRHLELVVSVCQHDSTLVPELLYKLEQSLRESRTSEVQTLACIAMNDGISVSDHVANADKLRTLVYTLRNCHLYWERRLRLTQRAITIAGCPQFATNPQVTQFLQRWTASMCLRRDWQMKLCHGLNRLIRAAQLVDAERFPLRPLHTIETRLDPEEMLRQEQVFLESIRFALDALHTESGILREALSVCDSQATTSPMALSLNGTMEELKHLLTRMLHDPRLGQSCSLKMPRDKFTAYIQTRVTEVDRLYALIKLAIRTQWELVGLEELVPESDYLTQRLAEIETALQLNPKTVRGSRLKRLSLLNAKWDQWNLKYEPVNFSQYTAGFAWTPISFSSTSVQTPIVTEESVELMVLRYRQLRNRLFNTLEKLNSEAGRVEDARVVRFKIVPDELPNWPKIGCTCNSDKINVDDLETNLLQNKATDVFKHANLLRDLYASLDLHSSQHTEIYTKSVQKTLELCLLVLSRSDRNLQLVTFFRQSADKLRSIGVNDLKHDNFSRAIEQLNELAIEVHVLHTITNALCQVFDDLSTKQDQISRPSWLVVLVASLNDLVDCLPAGVGLCSSPTCFGSNVMRVLYQVETQLNSDIGIGSLDSKTLPTAWFHKQLSLTDWLLVSNPHFTGDLKTERDIKNRILQARCQLDAVDHWTETIRLVQSKLEELALSSVCWQHFGRFELEHALMRLNALESYSKQTWLKARDQIPSCSRLVEWFIVRRMQLAHELCINQIRALDHQAVSPNTEHQVLNRLLADSQNGVTDLIGHLRRLMNTRLQWTNEWAAGEFPVYDLHVRLPREMDMIQLFTKLTMVERCCTQTKRRLSESTPNIPLRLPELELNNNGRSDEDAIAYSRDLLKQLVRCLYNRAWMRDCIGRTCEDAEKLRDLISTISGHVNEVRSVTHQLNVAIPTLTGFHMDELTMAVVELESMANEDRSERSNSVSAYKHSNNIGFTQHIKHAGRRLMELETCLEHACETVRVLLLFGRGVKFWKHLPSDVSLSVSERAIGLENTYEDSFICAQLRAAWTRLAQLGDRLGRIQAGLPVRPSNESSAGTLDEVRSTELDVSRRSTANRLDDDFGLADSINDTVPSGQRMDAEVVRKTSWNLRDLLGEHSCVYPECKQARDEMSSCVLVASKDQIGINEQVRETFINLVHFYAKLKKDLIERVRPTAMQDSSPSSPSARLMTTVRFRWQRDPDLVKQYEELMDQVIALKYCDLPQVRKLELKAKSLESLWWGPHGTVTNSREFDQQELHSRLQPEPKPATNADLNRSSEDGMKLTSSSFEQSTSNTHALQSPNRSFSHEVSGESIDQRSNLLNETQSTSINGELAFGDTSTRHATLNVTSDATPTYSDPSIGNEPKSCLSSTTGINDSPVPDAYSIMTTARELQIQKSQKAKLKRVRRQQRRKLVEQQKRADSDRRTQMLNEKSQSSLNGHSEELHEGDEEHMGSLYRSPNVWLSTHQVPDVPSGDNHTDSFDTFPSGSSNATSATSQPENGEKNEVPSKNVQLDVEVSYRDHNDRVNGVCIHGKYLITPPSLSVSHSSPEVNYKDQKVTHKLLNSKPHDDSDLQTIRLPLAASSPATREVPKPTLSGPDRLSEKEKYNSVCHAIGTVDDVSQYITNPLVDKLTVPADKVSFVEEINYVHKSGQKHEIPSTEAVNGNTQILFDTPNLSASSSEVHNSPVDWKLLRSNGVTVEAENESASWIKVERKLRRKPRTRKQRTNKSATIGPLKTSISDFSEQAGEHAVTVDANTAVVEKVAHNSEVSDPTCYPHAIPEPEFLSEAELEILQSKSTMHTVLEMTDPDRDQHTTPSEQTDYTIISSLNVTDLLNTDVPSSKGHILQTFEYGDQPSVLPADSDANNQQGATDDSWSPIDCAQLDPEPNVICGKPSLVERNQRCSKLETITEQPQITSSPHDNRQNESSHKRSYQSDTTKLKTTDETGDSHPELLTEMVNPSYVTSPQIAPLLNGIEMPSLSDDLLQPVALDKPHANIDSTHQIEHDSNMLVPSKTVMDGGVRRKIRKARRHGKTTISSPTRLRPTLSIPQQTRQPNASDQLEAESDHQLVRNDSFESNYNLHTNPQLAERDRSDNSREQMSSANSGVGMTDELSSLHECCELIGQSSEVSHSSTPHFSGISEVDGRKETEAQLIEGCETEDIDYSMLTTSLEVFSGGAHKLETPHVRTAPLNTGKIDDNDLAAAGLSIQPPCELDMKNNVVRQEDERIQGTSPMSSSSKQDALFKTESQRSPNHLPCHKEFLTDKQVGSVPLADQLNESSTEFRDNKLATILNLDQRRSHRLDTNQRSLESELQQISKLLSDSSSFQRPTEQTDSTEMVGVWKDNSQRSSSSFDPISEGVQQLGVSEVRKPDSTTRNSVNKPPMVKSIDTASGMFDCSHLNVSTGDEKFKSPNDDAWQAATQPTMHVPIGIADQLPKHVISHLGPTSLIVEKTDDVDSVSNVEPTFEQSTLTSSASLSCVTDPKIDACKIKTEVSVEDLLQSRTLISSDSKTSTINVYNQHVDSRSSLLSDPLANRELKSQSDRLTVVCRKSSRSGCSTLDITEAKPEDKLSVLEATQSGLHPLAGVKWRQSDKKTVDSALQTGYSDQSYDFSVPTDLITAEAHWIHPNDLGMTRKHVDMESEVNSSSSWTEVGTQTVESYTFHQEAIKRHSILDSKDGDDDENEFANVCNTANIAHTRKHSEHFDEGKYVHTRSGFATQNVSWNKSMQFDWMMDKAIQTDAYSKEIVIRRRQGILSSEQNLQQQMMEAKQQDTQNTSQEQLNSRSVTSSMKSASDSIIEPVTSVATTRSTCCRYLLPLLALLLSLLLLFLLLLCLFSKSTCTGINHSSDDCVEQTMLWRFLYRPLHTVRFRGVPI